MTLRGRLPFEETPHIVCLQSDFSPSGNGTWNAVSWILGPSKTLF